MIPWYSAASAGWAVGIALGNAELVQKHLAAQACLNLASRHLWRFSGQR